MTQPIKADICVIGAGSGGLSLAAGAVQLGKSVVLIEKHKMGGDCLNFGCVPSKALLAAARRAHEIRTSGKFGITVAEPQIDFSAVHQHVHRVIDTIAPVDSQERFEKLGCTVIRAPASFTGPRSVVAGDYEVQARHFVIATGSSAFVPPIKGLDSVPYLTNETVFDQTKCPAHLIVVGGGPIGIEMAQAHQRLGAQVTVVEGDIILPKDDRDLVDVIRTRLIKEGIKIYEGATVAAVQESKTGGVEVTVTSSEGTDVISGSHILIATGRRANVAGLELEKAGIAYDRQGIKTDARLRSSNKRVYVAGDVAGGRQFTHVAGYHAGIIIRNMIFKSPAKNKEKIAPWVTYCDPELAQVGLTEAMAKAAGVAYKIAQWSFDENDRAQAECEIEGTIKIITDKKGRLLGASIVGKNAGELIAPWALAFSNNMKISVFNNMIAPYPTMGEISKRAVGAWYTPLLFSERTRVLTRFLSILD